MSGVKTFLIACEEDPLCPVTVARFLHPLRHLKGNFDFRILNVKTDGELAMKLLPEAACLVLARSIHPTSLALAKEAKRLGLPIVMDIDDYMWKLPSYLGGAEGPILDQILALTDYATTPQVNLAEFLKTKNPRLQVHLLPNCGDILVPAAGKRTVSAVVANSDRFRLPEMRTEFFSALRDAAKGEGVTLNLFYFSADVPDGLTDDPNLKVIWCGIRSFSSFKELLVSLKPDLAFVPLGEESFNRYKSTIKFAEFGGLGIPAVFSNVEPYAGFIEDGKTGWLVPNTYEGWRRGTTSFLRLSPEAKVQLLKNIREKFEAGFRTDVIAPLYQNFFDSLLVKEKAPFSEGRHRLPDENQFVFGEAYRTAFDIPVAPDMSLSRKWLIKKFLATFPLLRGAYRKIKVLLAP